ncbi:MAG: hypothetical protein HKN64_03520 [Woeseiaceae bacterium]|nr:hypothetical protein [Woeseiaceae bacterium]
MYRGTAIPGLVDWYVFGDFVSGRIFAIPEDGTPLFEPELLLESGLSLVSFAVDTDAELYVLDFGVGTIHKLEAAP